MSLLKYYRIMSFLSTHSGEILSYKKIAEEVGISRVVARARLVELERLGVINTRRTKGGFRVKILRSLIEEPRAEAVNGDSVSLWEYQLVNEAERRVPGFMGWLAGQIGKTFTQDMYAFVAQAIGELYENPVEASDDEVWDYVSSGLVVPASRKKKGLPDDVSRLIRVLKPPKGPARWAKLGQWIRKHIDLVHFLRVCGVAVGRENGSGETACHCPFHGDRTPSFHANREKGIFHCKVCPDVWGDALMFVRLWLAHEKGVNVQAIRTARAVPRTLKIIRNVLSKGDYSILKAGEAGVENALADWEALFSGRTAIEELQEEKHEQEKHEPATQVSDSQETNDTLETQGREQVFQVWQRELEKVPELKEYLTSRGVSIERLRDFGCLWDDMHEQTLIATPVRAPDGRIQGFVFRGYEQRSYRHSNGFERSSALWGAHYAFERARVEKRLYIAEGIFDAAALESSGYPAVAALGCSLSEGQVRLIEDHLPKDVQIRLVFDNDEAGKKGAIAAASCLSEAGYAVQVCQISSKDPSEAFGKEGVVKLDETFPSASPQEQDSFRGLSWTLNKPKRDPRPDLVEDHVAWDVLLWLAETEEAHVDGNSLYGILHFFRAGGTRLRVNRKGKWVLRPDVDPTGKTAWTSLDEYRAYANRLLEPLKENVQRLLDLATECCPPTTKKRGERR